MKTTLKRWIATALAVALLGLTPGGALAQSLPYYWWFLAVDERNEPYTGQNVQCSIYRPNVHGAAVLHTSATLASGGTSPLWSDVGGKLHFYSTSQDPVDATCYYTFGGSGFSGRLRRTDHKIVLPRQGTQISRFAVNSVSATYQTDSGLVLPQGAVIRDVIVQNLNPLPLGQYHLSVGFLGNHSIGTAISLLNTQALTSSDEWVRGHYTTAVPGTGTATTNHRGTALQRHVAGMSWPIETSYVVHLSSGLQVSYSAQPGSGPGVRAHVYILWDRLHAPANALPFGIGR